MDRSNLKVVLGIFRAMTSAVDEHGLGVMEQPVQKRRGERAVIVEDLRPVLVSTIGSNDDSAAFVAAADHLEQQIGAALVDGEVPEFVYLC